MYSYDYTKLNGKIAEKCGTKSIFAKRLGISLASLSNKLSGKTCFTQEQIRKSLNILGIENANSYFFCIKSLEN